MLNCGGERLNRRCGGKKERRNKGEKEEMEGKKEDREHYPQHPPRDEGAGSVAVDDDAGVCGCCCSDPPAAADVSMERWLLTVEGNFNRALICLAIISNSSFTFCPVFADVSR